jgi:hypothetical protein
MKLTQRQRLLQAFQERGELYVYEIMAPRPNGLGISQYGARVLELRREGHTIINKEPGHFIYYKQDTAERNPMISLSSPAYQKFKAMGAYVKGEIKVNPTDPEYSNMGVEELKSRKEKAEAWLQANQDHANYPTALKRYEKICDYINLKESLL